MIFHDPSEIALQVTAYKQQTSKLYYLDKKTDGVEQNEIFYGVEGSQLPGMEMLSTEATRYSVN